MILLFLAPRDFLVSMRLEIPPRAIRVPTLRVFSFFFSVFWVGLLGGTIGYSSCIVYLGYYFEPRCGRFLELEPFSKMKRKI